MRVPALILQLGLHPEEFVLEANDILVTRTAKRFEGLQVMDRLEQIALSLSVPTDQGDPYFGKLQVGVLEVSEAAEAEPSQAHPTLTSPPPESWGTFLEKGAGSGWVRRAWPRPRVNCTLLCEDRAGPVLRGPASHELETVYKA